MLSAKTESRIEEIGKEKPEWDNKQVVIQAIGEIIEENDTFVDSFLLSEDFNSEHYGILWINEEIDYIPSKVLNILGENGMNVQLQDYSKTNQIEFR